MENSTENEDVIDFAKNIESFSSDLLEGIEKGDNNFVCTTLSCNFLLAMCATGAKSSTAREMYSALHLSKTSNFLQRYKDLSGYFDNCKHFHLINKIYIDKSVIVEHSFEDIVTSYFHSEIENVDFFNERQKAVEIMNKWCSKKTFGKIKNIITPDKIDDTTRMILFNVIYFKNIWFNQFQSIETKLKPFYTSNYEFVEVPTMKKFINAAFKNLKNVNADCIALPYKDTDFALLVIMSNEVQKPEGLEELEKNIKNNVNIDYKKDFSFCNENNQLIDLEILKFKIENTVVLDKPLESMGIKKMFMPYEANFRRISKKPELDPPLYANKILQKVIIDVNESGTKALGVTCVSMRGGARRTAGPHRWLTIKVNRPFLFRLVNLKTNLTLFSGRVLKPVYSK